MRQRNRRPQIWTVSSSAQIVKDRWIDLREETGYVADEIIDLGATWANWGNHTNRSHHFLARGCRPVAEQSLDDSETIAVHLEPLDGLGARLEQSYHLLTWLKAQEHLRSRAVG